MYTLLAATASDISAAFKAGAGVTGESVSYLIAGVALAAIFLWATWVIIADYEAFARGEVTFYDLLWHMVRAAIVVMLFILFVNPT